MKIIFRNALLFFAITAMMAACHGKDDSKAEGKKKPKTEAANKAESGDSSSSSTSLSVAFVELDSLSEKYEYYKDKNAELEQQARNAENTLKQQQASLEQQAKVFQTKMQSNQYTSQEEAEKEYNRLGQLEQALAQKQQQLAEQISNNNVKAMESVTDSINSFVQSYAKENGYDFIFVKSSGVADILYGNEAYDITDEVIQALNQRYSKKK